ncbi:MAG: thiamine pyrophosphate-dependent dehydrogenase E1 component subunit alpha [Deltaproteobacteria bacterium]|nr:thiamine pyrophosphate-dependent dehydrogenase E1 component subunit alpha [Deltaproteobacteria bacterium]
MNYPKDLLEYLYRMMLRIRVCEESFVEHILNREVKTPCHLYSGEEAVAVGLCAALSKEDYIFGNHRSHGHFLAKGGSMKEMVAEIYCRAAGCSRGRGGSMHLIDTDVGMMGAAPIVAGTISLALGAALASVIRGDGRVAVSFFGDGATGEGVLYESLNFAALKNLPLIFACENNLYATHMPIKECRVDQPISKIAEPYGIEIYSEDGNDVMQVYEASREAVETCRAGEGPVFMEFKTYRYRGHVGPDDNIQGSHTDIRPQDEIALWMEKDPITRFERHVMERQLLDSGRIQHIKEEVTDEVREAQAFARKSPSPRQEDLTKYVFA